MTIERFPKGDVSPKTRLAQLWEHVDELEGVYLVIKWKGKDDDRPSWSATWSSFKMSDLAMVQLITQKEMYDAFDRAFDPDDDGPEAA